MDALPSGRECSHEIVAGANGLCRYPGRVTTERLEDPDGNMLSIWAIFEGAGDKGWLSYMPMIRAFQKAIGLFDRYIGRHTVLVALYARLLGYWMGVPEDGLDELMVAGLCHDTGKIIIPRRVLVKAGPLDEAEWAIVRRHPVAGMQVFSPVKGFKRILAGIGHHHERWDGGGYPFGLKGTEIAWSGRLIAVADAFEAMTAHRSYRVARPVKDAVGEIADGAGGQFDPLAACAFVHFMMRSEAEHCPAAMACRTCGQAEVCWQRLRDGVAGAGK